MLKHDHTPPEKNRPTTGRLLAKLVRELLETEPVESLPDLTEALKVRCATLGIKPTNDDISDAYRMLGSSRALAGIGTAVPDVPRSTLERERPVDELSPEAATRLVSELLAHFAKRRPR